MATTVARLEAVLTADTSRFNRAMDDSDKKTSGFASKLGSIGKAGALAAGAAGVGALIYTLKTGISEWAESQKVAAQTEAVIKSTGGTAHVTAKEVDELANSIMNKSGIDDEAVKSGENMLLTFTNIRNEVGKGNDIFNQATSILADMSTALGTDMSKQAIQLGKALNDPIKGVSALARVGVTFTDQQKKMIKGMVESGDTMGAQKLILGELNKEFGGSAEAMGKTLPGQINILKENFNNFAGDLVGKMIPVLTELGNWLRKNWPEISADVKRVWDEDIKPTFDAFVELAGAVVDAIRENWGTIGPIVKAVGTVIENTIGIIVDVMKILAALLRGDWSAAWEAFKDAVSRMMDNIKTVITTEISTIIKLMKGVGTAMKNALVEGLEGTAGAAWDVINNIPGLLADKAAKIAGWGEDVGKGIKNAVVDGITGTASAAWDVVNNIGSWITDKASTILEWGSRIGGGIKAGILAGVKGIANAYASALVGAINAVIHLINAIKLPVGFDIETWHGIPKGFSINWGNPIDIPDIPVPKLAAGGIVTSPTLALLGEAGPEAVVPLGAGGRPIVVQLVADSRVLAEVLFDPLRDKGAIFKQQNGRAAF